MQTEDLRTALINREFERSQTLIEEWGRDILRQIRAATAESERQRIFESAVATGQQSLYLAHVVRAQIATELQANSASFLYSDADLEQPRWRVSG